MVRTFRSDADSAPVRLLSYPPPAAEELTSSWLIRLAVANEVRPTVLTRALGLPRLWEQDVDLTPDVNDLAVLARAARLPVEQVLRTSLRPLVEQLNGRVIPSGRNPLLLSTEKPRRARSARGHPVCLECLATTGVVSRAWRFATTVICELHGRRLTDVCPRCGVPIGLTRSRSEWLTCRTLQVPEMSRCPACQWHMRATSGPEADLPGWTDALYLQRLVLNAARCGRVIVDGLLLSAQELLCLLGPLIALPDDLRGPFGRSTAGHPDGAERHSRRVAAPALLEGVSVLQRWPTVARAGHLLGEGLVVCLDHLRVSGLTPQRLLGRSTAELTSTWFRDLTWEALSTLPRGRRLIPLSLQRPPGPVSIPARRWTPVAAVLPVKQWTSSGNVSTNYWSDLEVLETFLTRSLTGTIQTASERSPSDMTALKRLSDWMNAGQFDTMLDGLVGLLEQDLGGVYRKL